MKKTSKNGYVPKEVLLLIIAFVLSTGAFAQTTYVKGRVTDESGEGVPGVSVILKGTTTVGTTTDLEGHYSISFPKKDDNTLRFTFIGFEPQEIPVGSNSTINVTMKESLHLLDDVVVIGYGTQKKATVVGSVVQTSGDELLKVGNVTTVSEALAGMLPGVSTMQAAGMPGATEATILIRGQSSWNNNTPLFMVDGVEREFNDLDPNEIESISVLKDASATAVYGVKAANGVVLVTTKRGKSGAPRITFTANEGIKVPVINTDYMADYATALEKYNVAAMSEGLYGNLQSQKDIDAWRNPNRDMDYYSYTNWIDELMSTGVARSYNLNVSGGNDFVKYFTSLGYNYDGDIFNVKKQDVFDPRTSQKRYNWRSNLDFQFTKTTKVSINISGDFRDWHGNRFTASSPLGYDQSGTNNLAAFYSNVQVGTPPILSTGELGAGDKAQEWKKNNYLGEMERESENRKRSTRSNLDFQFSQEFLKDFLLKAKVSYDYDEFYNSSIEMSPLYFRTDYRTGMKWQFGDNPNAVEGLPVVTNESLDNYSNSLYYEGSLHYNKSINEIHNISALALFNRRKHQNKINFPSYEESWVGRFTYGYRDKYLFEFNGAYNGSEKFAKGNRFGFFPSLSAGWVISEESFFKNSVSFIDFLKIRYSWGEIGSDQGAGRFTYFSTYGTFSVANPDQTWTYIGYPGGFGGTGSQQYMGPLYFEQKPANEEATWETSIKQNLGIEISVLENRLKTSIDLYDEKRTGILMTRSSIPSWYGGQSPDANIGETKNHGFDLEINWNDKIGINWRYSVTANIAMSENRIVERDDAVFAPEYQKNAGKPIGWGSGLLQDGIYSSWNDLYIGPSSSFANLRPGDFRYVDYDGDGSITLLDKVPIGLPSYASNSFAFNLGVSYKQISLSAVFNGAFNLAKDLANSYLWEFATSGGDLDFRYLNTEMHDYWTPDNLDASRPALRTKDNKHNTQTSEYTRRRSDFMRLKNLELKYTFSKNTLSKIDYIKSLEMFVNGNNLFTWQKLPKEFDPEARSLEVYPIAKRFNIGLRVSF